jgi:hypothetical protein
MRLYREDKDIRIRNSCLSCAGPTFDPLPVRIRNARIYGIVGTGSFLFVNGDKLSHT